MSSYLGKIGKIDQRKSTKMVGAEGFGSVLYLISNRQFCLRKVVLFRERKSASFGYDILVAEEALISSR